VVPYRSGVKLKKLLKSNDQFIKIENGEHNNLSESVIYRNALDSLLEKWIYRNALDSLLEK